MPVIVPEPVGPGGAGFGPSEFTDWVWPFLPGYVRAADSDGVLRAYLGSVCSQADRVLALLAAHESWGDPGEVPSNRLGWLAALAGVDMTGIPRDRQRAWLESPLSRFRGTREAIVARVGQTLTGQRRVIVDHPYAGSVWHIRVRTFAEETPDLAVTAAAVRAEVPAWLRLTVAIGAGMTWDERRAKYGTWNDEIATGKTYDELATEAP